MKMLKRLFLTALCLALLFSCLACSKEEKNGQPGDLKTETGEFTPTEEETNFVCIQMESGDRILLELYPEIAPISVANFQKLVKEDYYNGVKFHRVIPGFVIQGGDPEGTGFGGPGYTIKGEFAANGVVNNLKHTRGVLSMARTSLGYNTAGSQFFIMHAAAPHLDGQYAAFGRVIHGMDVVDAIAGVQRNSNDMPLEDQVMELVYFMQEK